MFEKYAFICGDGAIRRNGFMSDNFVFVFVVNKHFQSWLQQKCVFCDLTQNKAHLMSEEMISKGLVLGE